MGLRPPVENLAGPLSAVLGGARIENLHRLSGGASRETWAFDADGRPLILQRQIARPDDARLGLAAQAHLLRAARAAGVPVPDVLAATDSGALGDAMIVERLDGETIPRKILRDDAFAGVRSALAAECGEALARIHAIPVDAVPMLEQRDEVALYRTLLDNLGRSQPAFELGFRWLASTPPPISVRSVVHGDFRNGNFIVGPDGIRAVIDWELAHVGDPMEDLGWLCVKSWRFGAPLPVGGFGTREKLFDAYGRASGRKVDPGVVRWWEVFGTIRWGVICIVQMMRHVSGAERSVELATIGRRVAEVEHDLMLLLP